jgi:gas vesicle protein
MSKNEKDLEDELERLGKARTEEEIMESLKSIMKGFSIPMYIDRIKENPYYSSLLPDVKNQVMEDISRIKDSIKEEIVAIDKEMKKEGEDALKLESLKGECSALLSALKEKEREIKKIT